MAKLDLNGVTLDEVKSNANSSYAANIISGEIYSVVCRHSKNGNVLLAVEGKALSCKSFDGSSFVADGCILYNPPLTKTIVAACDDSESSLFIVKGAVTTTAPASKPSSDTVASKEELQAEKKKLELEGKKTAKSRIDAIEKTLKNA